MTTEWHCPGDYPSSDTYPIAILMCNLDNEHKEVIKYDLDHKYYWGNGISIPHTENFVWMYIPELPKKEARMSDYIFTPPKATDAGVKYDAGKPRMDLIPTSALQSLANVLTYGAKKYQRENSWQAVNVNRYHAALLRHLVAWIDDPLGKDEESGLYHSEHLLWNAMAINDYVARSTK